MCVLSQKSRVALRGMESVVLLMNIPQEDIAKLLAEETALCDLLAQRACQLYSSIPISLHPEDLHSYRTKRWRYGDKRKLRRNDLDPSVIL